MSHAFDGSTTRQRDLYNDALNRHNIQPLLDYLKDNEINAFCPDQSIFSLPVTALVHVYAACAPLKYLVLRIRDTDNLDLNKRFCMAFKNLDHLEHLALTAHSNDDGYVTQLLSHVNPKLKKLSISFCGYANRVRFDVNVLKRFALEDLFIRSLDFTQPEQHLNGLLSALDPKMQSLTLEHDRGARGTHQFDFVGLRRLPLKCLELGGFFTTIGSVTHLLNQLNVQMTDLTVSGNGSRFTAVQPHHFVRKDTHLKTLVLKNFCMSNGRVKALMDQIAGSKLKHLHIGALRWVNASIGIQASDLEIIRNNLAKTRLMSMQFPNEFADHPTMKAIQMYLKKRHMAYRMALKDYVYDATFSIITRLNHAAHRSIQFPTDFLPLSSERQSLLTGTSAGLLRLPNCISGIVRKFYSDSIDASAQIAFEAAYQAEIEKQQKWVAEGIKTGALPPEGPAQKAKYAILRSALFQALRAVDVYGDFEKSDWRLDMERPYRDNNALMYGYLMIKNPARTVPSTRRRCCRIM